jgi:hypothetical protein
MPINFLFILEVRKIWASWGHTPFKSPPIFFSIVSLHLFRLPNTNTPPWRHLPPMCGMRIRFGPLSKVWKRSTFGTLFRPFFHNSFFFSAYFKGDGGPSVKKRTPSPLDEGLRTGVAGFAQVLSSVAYIRPNNNRYRGSFESTYKLLLSSGLDPGSGKNLISSGSRIQGWKKCLPITDLDPLTRRGLNPDPTQFKHVLISF